MSSACRDFITGIFEKDNNLRVMKISLNRNRFNFHCEHLVHNRSDAIDHRYRYKLYIYVVYAIDY